MTVSSSLAKKLYAGNGVTTAFPTVFQFFDASDLVVTLVAADGTETVQVITTNYTVTGGDGANGTVTMLVAPPSGATLAIEREVPYDQDVDYISNDRFPAEVTESALDKLTMLAQQAIRDVRSTPSLPITFDPDTDPRPSLPEPEIGQVLIGNDDATGWDNADLGDLGLTVPTAISSPAVGDILEWNGAAWANDKIEAANIDANAVTTPAIADNNVTVAKIQQIATDSFLGRDTAATGNVEVLTALQVANILSSIGLGAKYIGGLTYAINVGNNIDIAAGSAMSDDGTYLMKLSATLSKNIDNAWVVGSAFNGSLDTGSVGNSDYFLWLIARPDTGVVDAVTSLSATAPTMPANYTKKRLIGWMRRTAGSLVAFDTYETEGGGLEYRWDTKPLLTIGATINATRSLHVIAVPVGLSVRAEVNWGAVDAGVSVFTHLSCPDEAAAAASGTAAPLGHGRSLTTASFVNNAWVRTDTSARIGIACDSAIGGGTVDNVYVSTLSFIMARR